MKIVNKASVAMKTKEKILSKLKHDLRGNVRRLELIFEEIVKESDDPELFDDMNSTLQNINNDWEQFQSVTKEQK